jgi:hypothetical protein
MEEKHRYETGVERGRDLRRKGTWWSREKQNKNKS